MVSTVLAKHPFKILRVITWLPVGGIERRLVALLPKLDRELFDVSLVCIRERGPLADELEAAGIRVDCIPFRKRWDPRGLRQLSALMRERQIDLVHSHMYRSNVPATVAARMAGVPYVLGQVHNVGTWETRRQAFVDRFLCRWRTGMIAVSGRVQQDVMQTLRLPAERVPVVFNGVDTVRFRDAGVRREAMRTEHGAQPDDVVFIFAARLVEQKRTCDFLKAFGELQRTKGGGRLKAWILGDGPLTDSLRDQATAFAHPEAVKFFGKRADVEDFLAGADIFVLPSTKEGFSNALVEAMASGLAIVASDVGGNAEAIRDGRDGLIVPTCQPAILREAMETLWRDEPKRLAMAASAAERAETFSLDRMLARLQGLYMETLGEKTP